MKMVDVSFCKDQFLIALNRYIDVHLKKNKKSGHLHEAMRYALLSGGKRIRPLMVLSSALSLSREQDKLRVIKDAMPYALAVEFVHTYTLVHDDLPCMDNDDFRRGRPTIHRLYGNATAILVGDALLSDAFNILSKAKYNVPFACSVLSGAIGSIGVVLGQKLDIAAKSEDDLNKWLEINALKTAKLFQASALLGALSSNVNKKSLHEINDFGYNFGCAFQLKDDHDDGVDNDKHARKNCYKRHVQQAIDCLDIISNPFMLSELFKKTFF